MFIKTTDIGRLILEAVASPKPTIVKTASSRFSIDDATKISQGLAKVASYPYKEEVYSSAQEMMKIASDCLSSMASSLIATQARIDELEKAAAIRSVIDQMVASGITDESDIHEKIAKLSKKTPHELEVVKEAVDMAARAKGANVFFEDDSGSSGGSVGDEKRSIFDGVFD